MIGIPGWSTRWWVVAGSLAAVLIAVAVWFWSEGQGCSGPLLSRILERNASGGWSIDGESLQNHLSTLEFDEANGETDHKLRPVKGNPVKASIFVNKRTRELRGKESSRAVECGYVIGRIDSDGDHDPTKIRTGTNYLIAWSTGPAM